MNEITSNIMNHWALFIAGISGAMVIYFLISRFLTLPTAVQMKKVKEWLLYAVIQAEKELGGGTGELKLRRVYDMFIGKFPQIAVFISFEHFGKLVDDALDKMRKLLLENEQIKNEVTKHE